MLSTLQRRNMHRFNQRFGAFCAILAFSFITFSSAMTTTRAVADDWEWDPTWGYHQEEWYDPSDWFNSHTDVDYEDQYYGDYYDDYYYDGDYYDGDYYETGNYAEDDLYEPSYPGYRPSYGYDYYTNDWYDDEPDFDNWYYDTWYY